MGRLLVSSRCSVAVGAFAPPNCRFHHRLGLQISDHHGHPRVCLGKVRSAGAGVVALSVSTIRPPLGTPRLEKAHPPLGPACDEPMKLMPRVALLVGRIA